VCCPAWAGRDVFGLAFLDSSRLIGFNALASERLNITRKKYFFLVIAPERAKQPFFMTEKTIYAPFHENQKNRILGKVNETIIC
jgi:hypothetical protein